MSLNSSLRARFQRWALRGRQQETTPVILSQNRIYVLPTRRGLAFGGMLGLMLTGAMNYNLSLGYALVFLLAGLGTLTILHTFRNLAYLEILPGRSLPVFAGQTARFGLVLVNTRPSHRHDLRLHLPDSAETLVTLSPGEQLDIQLDHPAPRRGWLAMPRLTLETTYPLGLVRAWGYALPKLHCLIYPAPASSAGTPPLPPADGMNTGHRQTTEGMDDFAGLRRHQPADPLQHVAWKAAARLHDSNSPLLTKQFSSTAAHTLHFDWHDLPPTLDVEQRLSLLTRWICDAHTAGLRWGLRLPAANFPAAAGEEHFHACLKQLALHGTPR